MSTRGLATILWSAAIAACLGAAWLFLPSRPGAGAQRAPLRAVLVDASDSATCDAAWLPWVRAELRRAAGAAATAGEELAVLSFGDGVATGFAPGAPAAFLERLDGARGAPFDPGAGLAGGATRLADALAAVEPLLVDSTRRAGSLALLGPATYTGEDPRPCAARLAAAGIAFERRTPPPPARGDLALLELVLPRRVEVGATLVALARLQWRGGSAAAPTGALEFEVACGGVVRTSSREFSLPGVDGAFELPVALGPAGAGRSEVRARCRLADGADLRPENDRAEGSVRAGEARVIGVLARPEERAAAGAWLAGARVPGLELVALAPEDLAAESAELDAFVSFDLAPSELPAELVQSFLRRGGGWLALTGFHFLAERSATEDALARQLPSLPARDENGPRDVVLLLDGSGSMEGEPFENVRVAALELVGAALPSDRVSLRFFTQGLEPEHVLKERSAERVEDAEAARRAARERLALRVPAGTTFLLRALGELARAAGERETLALLLTDGFDREGLPDPLVAARERAAELAAARVRLVVIGVGEANEALLGALAGGAERVRSGRTLGDLGAIFRRELHAREVAEGELALTLAPRAPGSLADEVASAGATAELPPVERYVRCVLRPGGEALWQSAEGEPVLALARAGLGRVALLAALPEAGWASRYARSTAELEGLLRWLARGPTDAAGPRARCEARRLVVSELPEAPAVLDARLALPSGASESLRLFPPATPGLDALTTRVAELARDPPAGAILWLRDGTGGPDLALPIVRGPSDEALGREAVLDWESLERAAAAGSPRSPAERRASALAPWTLALGLALLLAAGLATGRGQGVRAFDR